MDSPKPSKTKIQDALVYSQITFAMNAARVIKAIGLGVASPNRTQNLIMAFAQEALIVNSTKIWDKTGTAINIERFFNRKDIKETERQELLKKAEAIRKEHKVLIERLGMWRNELVAHLGAGIVTTEQFNKFNGDDIADIQKMLKQVSELLQSTSWYPSHIKMEFIDYAQIEDDLRLR